MTDADDIALERPTLRDGTPAVSMEQRLQFEVERLEVKLESARDDLRRWRLRDA